MLPALFALICFSDRVWFLPELASDHSSVSQVAGIIDEYHHTGADDLYLTVTESS
jgi:hypothetical protein